MTDKNYFHIALVVDQSGSMGNIMNDMNGAIQGFLDEQKKTFPDKKILVDVIGFHSEVNWLIKGQPIAEVEGPFVQTLGMTALYDGIGTTIDGLGLRFKTTPEKDRPSKVIIVVITDGFENHSREYTQAKVKSLVTNQESKYEWAFVFLGANIDSFGVGGGLGFQASSTANYVASTAGVRSAMASTAGYTTSYLSGQAAVFQTVEDEEEDLATK